jgi:hypothetical protein
MLQGQRGSVLAAVAAVSQGPISGERKNFCDFCTHTRIDVWIATSDSMALRDVPHDSSVTTRKNLESVLHQAPAFLFTFAQSPSEWIRVRLCVHIAGATARPSAGMLTGTGDPLGRMLLVAVLVAAKFHR